MKGWRGWKQNSWRGWWLAEVITTVKTVSNMAVKMPRQYFNKWLNR